MNCPHHFHAGSVIKFLKDCSCDVCGSPIRIDGHYGYYMGDNSRGHVFILSPLARCPGCGNWLSKMHVPCGEGWRVPELEKEQETEK